MRTKPSMSPGWVGPHVGCTSLVCSEGSHLAGCMSSAKRTLTTEQSVWLLWPGSRQDGVLHVLLGLKQSFLCCLDACLKAREPASWQSPAACASKDNLGAQRKSRAQNGHDGSGCGSGMQPLLEKRAICLAGFTSIGFTDMLMMCLCHAYEMPSWLGTTCLFSGSVARTCMSGGRWLGHAGMETETSL